MGGVNICIAEDQDTSCSASEIQQIRDHYNGNATFSLPASDAELNCRVSFVQASIAFPTSYGSKGVTIRTDKDILSNLRKNCDSINDFDVFTFSDPNDEQSPKTWQRITGINLFQYIKDHNARVYTGTDIELHFTGECAYRPYNTSQRILGDDAGPNYNPNGIPDGRKDGFTYINGIINKEDLKESIVSTANDLFGESNYTFVSIANLGETNPDGCANKVESKSTDVLDISHTEISICEENYDSAFAWFDEFLKFAPQPMYTLTDPALELQDTVRTILSIKLDYQDNSLDKSEYEFKDGKLTFKNPDILRFIGGEKFEIKYRNVVE